MRHIFLSYLLYQVHKAGELLCVGDSHGSASVIELDHSLATCTKLDRGNAGDMFDR